MIELSKMKYLKLYKESVRLPVNEDDIHKLSCVIMLNKNKDSIVNILNNKNITDRNLFKLIYRNRNFEDYIKKNKVILRDNVGRNEYYKICKDRIGLTGVIAFSSINERNFYYDLYFENNVFFNNMTDVEIKIKAKEYWFLIGKLKDNPMLEKYKKTILIDVNEWKNFEDNPINLLTNLIIKNFEEFKSLGDIDILFIGNGIIMKMNPNLFEYKDKNRMNFLINELEKSVDNESDILNAEVDLSDEEDELSDEDIEIADKISKQESELEDNDNEENEIDEEEIVSKVLEPIPIKKDSISKRDQELREKQKQIKIDNIKLGDIDINHDNRNEIPVNDISNNVNTLNKNLTKIKFVNFNETYNKEHYERDILSIANSMKSKSIPVYIRDVKVEDTSDTLNQKVTYTFHLEDTYRGRHTLKFDMPKFIDGKFMYLNGNKKEFLNQFISKPIVKVGPDLVQLVSNYNKIFMRRAGEKVEALYEKFKDLVLIDKKHFSYKRGDCSRLNKEYKTTIEYDTFAKQFAEIVIKPNSGPKLVLVFSQPRLKELCEKHGLINQWQRCQESDRLAVGYIENGNKYSLFDVSINKADITRPKVLAESVGDPFNADEYTVGVTEMNNKFSTSANIIFSEKDIVCNIEKFKNNEVNILFVTGYSGSGKSTLALDLARKSGSVYVELDALIYRGLREPFTKEWCEAKRAEILWMYIQEKNKPLDFMVKYKNKKHNPGIILEAKEYVEWLETKPDKFIVEGVDVTRVIPTNPKWYEYPIIFKGTSMITSMIRKLKRDDFQKFDDIKNIEVVELISWYNKMNDEQSGLRANMIFKDNHFEMDG